MKISIRKLAKITGWSIFRIKKLVDDGTIPIYSKKVDLDEATDIIDKIESFNSLRLMTPDKIPEPSTLDIINTIDKQIMKLDFIADVIDAPGLSNLLSETSAALVDSCRDIRELKHETYYEGKQ